MVSDFLNTPINYSALVQCHELLFPALRNKSSEHGQNEEQG